MADEKQCRRGHVLTPENVNRYADGRTECRECRRARQRRWWHEHYQGEYAERHRQRTADRYYSDDPEIRKKVLSKQVRDDIRRRQQRRDARAVAKDALGVQPALDRHIDLEAILQGVGFKTEADV